MSRIRSVKPGFFAAEELADLPLSAERTLVGLWTMCDDHGRGRDNIKLIKGAIWPLRAHSLADVEADMDALAGSDLIARYVAGGKKFFVVVNWHGDEEWTGQRPQKPSAPKYPAPPAGLVPPASFGNCAACSGSPTVGLRDSSGSPTVGVPNPSGTAPVGLSPVVVEVGVEVGEGGTREERAPRPSAAPRRSSGPAQGPPPSKCEDHEHDPAPPACRACGDARRSHDAWVREHPPGQSTAPTPVPEAPPCPLHPEQGPGSSRHCPACAAERVPAPSNIRAFLAPGSDRGLIA